MKQTFTIPFRLPGLNELISANRRNPYAGALLKKRTDESIRAAILAAGLEKVTRPCIVICRFVEENRRRDVDNVESGRKFILDALTGSGILEGDSPHYVVAAPAYVTYDKRSRVEVSIITAEAEELTRWVNDSIRRLEDAL